MADRRLADRVFENILRKLIGGTWIPGGRVPPMRDLAKEMGVSHVTLQAAFRRACESKLLDVRQRHPVTVLPEADARAHRLLERLTARPAARHLAILVPEANVASGEIDDRYWRGVAAMITREAARKTIQASVVSWPLLTQVAFAHELPTRGYGAAVALAVTPRYLGSLHELTRQRFPVLLHDRWIPWLQLPAVTRDDYGAARRVGEMLAQRGHRNMCAVCQLSPGQLLGARDSIAGWLDFLRDAGLIDTCRPPVCYVPPGCDPRPFVSRVFDGPDTPTAVVFAGTIVPETLFQDEHYNRIRIPEQLSMATFGPSDSIPTEAWRPALTSGKLDQERMTQCVIESVEKMLAGELHPPSIRVPLRIISTGSIGDVPTSAT